MSTYNGEKYLADQIESIRSQTFGNFVLYVRDDGSRDSTLSILDKYETLDSRIKVLKGNSINLGVTASFLELLYKVSADIYFFCDQDDLWEANKIETLSKHFENNSNKFPLLVHSDLNLIDSKGKSLGSTFNLSEDLIFPKDYNSRQALLQNSIVGCSLAFNQALRDVALKGYENRHKIALHDWWIALCALYFGEVVYLDTPLINYRQHENNVSGTSKKMSIPLIVKRVKSISRYKSYKERIISQLELFMDCFANNLDVESVNDMAELLNFLKYGGIGTVFKVFFSSKKIIKFKSWYMNFLIFGMSTEQK
ncbi:TPA: glycosyltransferase family 2 protein [Vibrio vulnificus]